MVDIEVSNDLRSNLLYQSGLISSIKECLYYKDMNNKLKCTLDEISSLNLIIKFLVNELKTDCASTSLNIVPSTLRENTDNQDEHTVPIHENWIKVASKHSINSSDFSSSSSLVDHQPIPTFSHYAQLINLQDSAEGINNTIVSNKQGLLCVSQMVDRQIDVINMKTNCICHIPTVLNGEIYSKETNKTVNCAIKRNVRHAGEVSVNIFPPTVNVRMQSSTKHRSKAVILGDSHLKGCTEMIGNHLGDAFRITG